MLASRMAAAAALAANPGSKGKKTSSSAPRSLLPFDVVRDYLETHALVRGMHISAKEVHAALLSLHAHILSRPLCKEADEVGEKSDGEESESDDPGDPWQSFDRAKNANAPTAGAGCWCCGGTREELDAHEGHWICTSCGAVRTLRSVNVKPEYVAPPVVRRSRVQRANWVPRHLLARSACVISDPADRRSRHWESLQHWNGVVGLVEDDLACADRRLREWGGEQPVEARIAAALLYVRLKPQFPSESDVRARLKRGRGLETIADPTPSAKFACAKCGSRHHTARDARMHCWVAEKWGAAGNPRKC